MLHSCGDVRSLFMSGTREMEERRPIKKGDELGMFHSDGSTHCLVFREGVKIEFSLKEKECILICAKVGEAVV